MFLCTAATSPRKLNLLTSPAGYSHAMCFCLSIKWHTEHIISISYSFKRGYTTTSNILLYCQIISTFRSWMINSSLDSKNCGLLISVPLSSHLFVIMTEESCLPWFHPAWGASHTWQQAWKQHDMWGNTLSFLEGQTHPPRQVLMTSKTFLTKSATPLTALTFDWQEGYPTLRPWSPPPLQLREQIMSNMGEVGSLRCQMSKKKNSSCSV